MFRHIPFRRGNTTYVKVFTLNKFTVVNAGVFTAIFYVMTAVATRTYFIVFICFSIIAFTLTIFEARSVALTISH
jgi:hypothetical protein